MWLILLFTIFFIGFIYKKLQTRFQYWTEKGVPQRTPKYFCGHIFNIILRKTTIPDLTEKLYNFDQNARYFGMYQFLSPALCVRDPELIKEITIKNFDHFIDHNGFVSAEADPLLGPSLVNLNGQKWRDMRSNLSPAFTSSKMKYLFALLVKTSDQFVQYFFEKNEKEIKVEMKDVLTKFANDVIANTIFGFECDSLKNPENEFYLMGKEATDFTNLRKMFVIFGHQLMPELVKKSNVKLFSQKMTDFFVSIVKENIKSRENNKTTRPDMISLLLENKTELKNCTDEQKMKQLTDEDIAAQAFIFFFAGFESVSALLCFMSHELAINQDVQERLRQEIDEVNENCQGNIKYEEIMSMKYMDMVVSETLRKYPNAILTDRKCTKPYVIQPVHPNEKPLKLEVGEVVIIPMYGIHRDPKYYPEPDRFIPERFSEENKHKINPYAYFPFGLGPRNCIGSRFALMETKVLFFKLLTKFEIHPVEETQIPIKFSKEAMNMTAEKGFWVGLRQRKF